ncbi:ParB/RepB/Spo0J family partition protein [Microbacterium sp. HA-8]|uniref:ParB/RepB/Spo0J family partition protein n=1 Tax=Microbacterium sp. HA-8 TaxID=3234200 RepID=UPI0038F76706
MAAKRTGLGRGIGALIPTSDAESRPVDVFFPGSKRTAVIASSDEGAPTSTPEETGSVLDGPASAPATRDSHDTLDSDSDTPGGEILVEVPGARLVHVDPHDIVPNPRQPRSNFDPDDLAELVHSVREFGVLQPVVVRPRSEETGTYELIMGERRTRAAREAGLDSIPAVVRDTQDEHLLRDALLENLHRSQLNPLEEASAYEQLLADFGITQEELASRIGRSRPQISNTIRLLRLPVPVQQRVAAGVLSAGHARAILSLDDGDAMQRLADKIVNEDLSVRAAEAVAKGRDAGGRRLPKPQAGARRGHLDDVAERLGDRFNTRVKISLTSRKGQVIIDFASVQDLNRILSEIGESAYSEG